MNPKQTMIQENYDFILSFQLLGIFTYYKKNIVLETLFNHATRHIESIVTKFWIEETSLQLENIYVSSHEFVQYIFYLTLHTTHPTNNSSSMLEQFWSIFPIDNIASSIFHAYWTDHHAICLSVNLSSIHSTDS